MIPKPGYKTTEFWVTTLVTVGALIAALADKLPPRYAVYAGMASQGAYALSRALTKFGALVNPVVPVVTAQAPAPPPPPPQVQV